MPSAGVGGTTPYYNKPTNSLTGINSSAGSFDLSNILQNITQPAPITPPPNPYLSQIATYLQKLMSASPYGDISAALPLLQTSKTAALSNLEQYSKASQGSLLGRLFGSNMQMSSPAIHHANALSADIGNKAAQIEKAFADAQLGQMQYAGGFGQQGLQTALQGLLGAAGIDQAGYLGQGNLQLGQNNQAMNLLQMVFGMLGNLGSMSGLGGGGVPLGGGGGAGGYTPNWTGNPTQQNGNLTPEQIQQMVMNFIKQILGGLG